MLTVAKTDAGFAWQDPNPLLKKILRRFECRDVDGAYWVKMAFDDFKGGGKGREFICLQPLLKQHTHSPENVFAFACATIHEGKDTLREFFEKAKVHSHYCS
jgi:hypothetical protein